MTSKYEEIIIDEDWYAVSSETPEPTNEIIAEDDLNDSEFYFVSKSDVECPTLPTEFENREEPKHRTAKKKEVPTSDLEANVITFVTNRELNKGKENVLQFVEDYFETEPLEELVVSPNLRNLDGLSKKEDHVRLSNELFVPESASPLALQPPTQTGPLEPYEVEGSKLGNLSPETEFVLVTNCIDDISESFVNAALEATSEDPKSLHEDDLQKVRNVKCKNASNGEFKQSVINRNSGSKEYLPSEGEDFPIEHPVEDAANQPSLDVPNVGNKDDHNDCDSADHRPNDCHPAGPS